MRKTLVLLAAAALLLVSATPAAGSSGGYQQYANTVVTVIKTPQLAPGQSGPIEMKIFNPFNQSMTNASLRLSIYDYATTNSHLPVAGIPYSEQPALGPSGTAAFLNLTTLSPHSAMYANFTVNTTQSTMHGDFFDTGTYFVSTYLSFDLGGIALRMASKGFFSASEWSRILIQSSGSTYLNYTYLNGTLGFQGIIPDTSFTVNSPSPLYLLWITGGLASAFGAASFLMYRAEKRRRPR